MSKLKDKIIKQLNDSKNYSYEQFLQDEMKEYVKFCKVYNKWEKDILINEKEH